MIFYTADTHFGHANIIRYCKRPYQSASEMDDVLIAGWNTVVPRDGIVYHLGDFAFASPERAAILFAALKGAKHLVIGNHDDKHTLALPWESVSHYKEVSDSGHLMVLSHYAFRVWNKQAKGSIHLYGHSHGALPSHEKSLDVGVDCWGFRPTNLTCIKQRLAYKCR